MQVVSGRLDYPKVHFEAPPRQGLEERLNAFIDWFNQSLNDSLLDPLLRAGITHLWFVTLHPFDDGNGRITRTLTDLSLAQMDEQSIRLYAMSTAILNKRKSYYEILEQTQKNDSDITDWLVWFLDTLNDSLEKTLVQINRTLFKSQFWHKYSNLALSEEQRKVLNRLLDGGENGFEHGISASQYQKLLKQVRRQLLVIYLTYLRKVVSSNWKVGDVIHAIRSILSYRNLSHKKARHAVGLFHIGLLVLLISCCPFLALFSYSCFLETSSSLMYSS
jgi:Fic family protein